MHNKPNKEALEIEFKSDLKRLSDADLIDAVVGMCNTSGGELFVGIEDDGRVTGVCPAHEDAIGVIALVANKTQPSLAVQAELVDWEGKKVLKIDIPKSDAIVATSDGRILRRQLKLDGTPENVPMYPYEISIRLAELGHVDYSGRPIKNASVADFDLNERNRLRDIIGLRKGDRYLLELSDEELDKALNFVRKENGVLYPTVTGILLMGKSESLRRVLPTASAVFQALEGTSVRVNETMVLPLLATFERMANYFNSWNPSTEMEEGLFRLPVPEFSENAFREGLVNAFCHRDYSIMQSVRLAIEDEGLTISSPGGFIEGVNLKNLLTVEPHGRNPTLADALKRIGLAERTGRGIDRIFEGSIIYGRPLPDYSESTSRCVKLFLQRAKADLAFTRMISNEENRIGRSLPINSLLILSALQMQRRLDLQELADVTNLSESRVRSNIERLVESGLVESVRAGKRRDYLLSARVYRMHNNLVGYVRQTGLDQIRNDELVLKLLEKQGFVTRGNVRELLGLTTSQAYHMLKRLADQKGLKKTGEGRSARYVKS